MPNRTDFDSATFYQDAQRYDLVTGALSGLGPLEFYKRQAMRFGGPALELACGTGRLTIPIAQSGVEVVGLDASPEMLALAESKASASGVTVTWVRGDVRNFDLGRRFHCIYVAGNSFAHLYSRADIEACLDTVQRHLGTSGRFIFDVFNPKLRLFVRPVNHRSPVVEYRDPHSGGQVSVSKTVRYDSETQISHETWYFRDELTGAEQAIPLNIRMFFPQEIDALLHYNGFEVEQKFGDHHEAPFTDSSLRQVLVCRLH